MSFILNIHTALETAIVSIAENDIVIKSAINTNQKDHASFLQVAIKKLLYDCNLSPSQINAIAVTIGPGSYTGLRVGMASAKGLCYALKIPLIGLNTLEVMVLSVINSYPKSEHSFLFCPMIDARRMEIFTAVYNYKLEEILSPCSMVITSNSFEELLEKNKIIFFGSGANKILNLIINENVLVINAEVNKESLARLGYQKFLQNKFENLPYAEPLYIKQFYTIYNHL